jgi:hypothetical protein
VGWFSIAIIVGFLLFWSWRKHLQAARDSTTGVDATRSQNGGKNSGAAKLSACVVRCVNSVLIEYLPAVLAVLLVLWGVLFIAGTYVVWADEFNTFLLEEIRRGYATRFILGLILGFGTGYVLEQRSRAADDESSSATARTSIPLPGGDANLKPDLQAGAGDAGGSATDGPAGEPPSPLSSLARLGTNALLTIGIGMFVLAIASPHLDSWLNHVTKIKLPYGELTVATSTTHRTINSDALLYLADSLSLTLLSKYREKLDQDIEYIEFFQIPEMDAEHKIREQSLNGDRDTSDAEDKFNKLKLALEEAKSLKPVFDHVISPIANCVLDAINNGMSVERVRRRLRLATESLEEIILAGDRLTESEMEEAHNNFWTEIKLLPEFIKNYLDDEKAKDKDSEHIKECRSYFKSHERQMPSETAELRDTLNLPRMKAYTKVPYLGVAAFLFSAFVRDDELGQRILEKTSKGLQYKDKEFLYFQSYIGYYKGLPTETAITSLEELLKDAREHKRVLQEAEWLCEPRRCLPTKTRLIHKLLKREQEAELRSINDLAYYIGDSIARGVPSAMSYKGRAEDYVEQLYRSLDSETDLENRNEFLDTYAYVSIVLESRKSVPEPDKFRRMLVTLEKAAEYFEEKAPKTDNLEDATARANLALVRAHLAAARELAE